MQMREYILANEQVHSCTCNQALSYPDSLTINTSVLPAPLSVCSTNILQHDISLEDATSSLSNLNLNVNNKNIVMFSDEMGKNMGQLLSKYYKEQRIINLCFPGLSYKNIINKICEYNFTPDTTVLIFIGNRGNVNKRSMLQFHNNLSNLNVQKIVMFTFPYHNWLPQEENNIRYKLNMTLHLLTCNDNKFHLLDTNNYVSKHLFLTKDSNYLLKFCKRQIAMSLAYYFDISAKNLANSPASIEQNLLNFNVNDINCNLN